MICEIKEARRKYGRPVQRPSPIEAVAIGSTAARILNEEGVIGRVYGVFDRAVNILADGDELFTLTRKDVSQSPLTILLNISRLICLPEFGMKPGAKVIKSGPFLRISHSEMVINLDKAVLWKTPRQTKTVLAGSDIMKNWDKARVIAQNYGKRGSLSDCSEHLSALVNGETINTNGFDIYSRKAFPNIAMLLRAILSRNLVDLPVPVSGLIGLGPGLTPSCDDMLMGLMSSLFIVAETLNGGVHYIKEVNRAVIASFGDGQTTLLSQRLLEHAARGETSELAYNMIEAILNGTGEQIREATIELLALGHFSGKDILLGILLGIGIVMKLALIPDYK